MFQLGRAILSISLVIIIVNHVRNFLLADTISRSDWVGKINVRTDFSDNEQTRRTPASSQQVSSQPVQLEVGSIEQISAQSAPGSVSLSHYTIQSRGDETLTRRSSSQVRLQNRFYLSLYNFRLYAQVQTGTPPAELTTPHQRREVGGDCRTNANLLFFFP